MPGIGRACIDTRTAFLAQFIDGRWWQQRIDKKPLFLKLIVVGTGNRTGTTSDAACFNRPYLGCGSPGFGIMAPLTIQWTALQEQGRSNPRSVVQRISLYMTYPALNHGRGNSISLEEEMQDVEKNPFKYRLRNDDKGMETTQECCIHQRRGFL